MQPILTIISSIVTLNLSYNLQLNLSKQNKISDKLKNHKTQEYPHKKSSSNLTLDLFLGVSLGRKTIRITLVTSLLQLEWILYFCILVQFLTRKLRRQMLPLHRITTQKPIKDITYLGICSHNPFIHMLI